MDLISVIVPIYNAEKYLDRCIKSISGQSHKNLQILLVDDGSTDNSALLCEEWAAKDSRIKAIHQQNSGVSTARNVGLDNAEGKYILQVDSDDYLHPQTITLLLEALLSENADLSICDFEKGTDNSFSFESNIKKERKAEVINCFDAIKRSYLNSENALRYIAPWGKLYKKELFAGIRYPIGKIFEDIYVTHQILCQCEKIAVIPDKLVYYYQHSESIMNKAFNIKKLDYLQALKERIDFFHSNGLEELEQTAYDEYLHSLIWEYSRARDLLGAKEAMTDIKERFRQSYKKGYASKRYPKETKWFLKTFNDNPEFIMYYWRINAKLDKYIKRK
ncbi:MAG: glycosyltransferase [Erysipelotrichaceae bacterium]|nr:glycosyltransferase [Erysipelotrichaceae bacterium]